MVSWAFTELIIVADMELVFLFNYFAESDEASPVILKLP